MLAGRVRAQWKVDDACWRRKARYGAPDVADLAAAFGSGIARNPPFIDGNKRVEL